MAPIEMSEQMWNLLIAKIDTLGDAVEEMRQDIKDDRLSLKTDRANCNSTHNTRMQGLEDKVSSVNLTMAKWIGGFAVGWAAIMILLKIEGII
jgi:hypothetical protein